jgi:parallel beta-helix repeat protein
MEVYVSKHLVYAALGLTLIAPPALAARLVVDSDGKATSADCDAPTPTPYLTIQSAIDAAASGDIVIVCPGTGPYDEQPVVDKPLTVSGRRDATVKPSPMLDNTTSLTTGMPLAAGILVKETSEVTIESIAVDGADNGGTGCLNNPVGIYFRNASGTIRNAATRNLRLGAGLEGCQGGLGVLVQSGGGGSSTVLVQGNSVHDYQKNGITASGTGTNVTARRNRVTGLGPTPFIAQNGIQVSFGAAGTVEDNVVANHVWTGCNATACPFVSTNVLIFQAGDGVIVRGNTVANSQVSIDYFDTDGGRIQGNDVTQSSPFDGIAVEGGSDGNVVQGNTVSNSDEAGIFLDGDGNSVRRNTINEAPIGIWNFDGTNTIPTTGFQMNHFFNVGEAIHSGMTLAPPLRLLGAPRTAREAAPSPAR